MADIPTDENQGDNSTDGPHLDFLELALFKDCGVS